MWFGTWPNVSHAFTINTWCFFGVVIPFGCPTYFGDRKVWTTRRLGEFSEIVNLFWKFIESSSFDRKTPPDLERFERRRRMWIGPVRPFAQTDTYLYFRLLDLSARRGRPKARNVGSGTGVGATKASAGVSEISSIYIVCPAMTPLSMTALISTNW